MPKLIRDDKLKMYILVRESIPLGVAVVNVAHASLGCYRKFADDPQMQEWISGPFYKVVCKVNDKDFEACKKVDKHVIISEGKFGGEEICMAFCPRWEWPRKFKFFRMYGARENRDGIVYAPWSDRQVASINSFQQCNYVHSFTCGECRNDLVAKHFGFVCPTKGCEYRQDWCHEFMADGSWERNIPMMAKPVRDKDGPIDIYEGRSEP